MVNIKMFYHPKYYKELRKRNKEAVAKSGKSHASLKSDQVISKSKDDGQSERAPGPGLKQQDNNASFEGISEAEYNKRHMKALKDADPGLKLQAPSAKRQAPSSDKNS
jgi:hypothetical protein